MSEQPKYFIYKKFNGMCFPEIWYDDFVTGTDKHQHNNVSDDGPLVFFHNLTDEEKELTLDQLDEKFKGILNEKALVHYRNFRPAKLSIVSNT
jgi:hypothetical protein